MMEIHCIVSGKVQKVAYRYYMQDAAGELKLTGWTRNLTDGTVEVLAQGELDILKEFVEYLYEGSLLSKVEGVDIVWRETKEVYEDFSILH